MKQFIVSLGSGHLKKPMTLMILTDSIVYIQAQIQCSFILCTHQRVS